MNTKILELHDSLTRLALAPAVGGSIVNWTVRQNDQPLLRPSDPLVRQNASPRHLACYPLAPWSNRIGNGGFANPDGWLSLQANADNSPLPIHGSAWQQAWEVVSHTQNSAVLRLDSQIPFPFLAEQRFTLQDGRLSIHLQVQHKGEHPAWYGLGLHPYFPRSAHTQLQAMANTVWLCGADQLPTHEQERPLTWNFDTPQALPANGVDNAFTHWNGHARIIEPEAGYQLEIHAQACPFYLLFCPENMPFFCFEPVTHPVNAHHMNERPGLKLLHAQERTDIHFSVHYRAL